MGVSRLGRAEAGAATELSRLSRLQAEALSLGARLARRTNEVAGAYNREAAAKRRSVAESTRLSRASRVGGRPATGTFAGVARGAGTVALGAAAAAGFGAFRGIQKAGELAQEVAGLKGLTGLSAKEGQALAVTAKALNLNTRSLGMAFGTLGKQVVGLERGTKSSVEAFRVLDISPAKVSSLKNNLPALFDLVFARTQHLPQAQRAGVLKQVLGRGGLLAGQLEALGPVQGQLAGVQKELGNIDPKKLEQLHVAEVRLKIATTGLQLAFAQLAAGPLTRFLNKLRELTQEVRKGEWGKFGDTVGKMGEELGKVVERVMPHVADAFARAGPKMLLAFARGFAHAGLGGQALIAGVLLTKLGITRAAFAGAGSKALGWFSGGWGRGPGGKVKLPGGGGLPSVGGSGISGARGPVGAGSLANPIAVVMEGGGRPGGGPAHFRPDAIAEACGGCRYRPSHRLSGCHSGGRCHLRRGRQTGHRADARQCAKGAGRGCT
jgi:hypothetical protein